jgi:tripartite-type tricarboxylate transporter receptor subunit TctC
MRRISAALALATLIHVAGATAQTYPSRPITIIVPVAAGGVTDIVARVVGERMRASLGQPVLVENVTGAGGVIGVTRLFRSAPDGYTLVVGQWSSHVGAGAMYPVPFDYLNDFELVSLISNGAIWLSMQRPAGGQSRG